jgi:hypothetical protein
MNKETNIEIIRRPSLIKIALDLHLRNYRVVRQINQSSPEPAQLDLGGEGNARGLFLAAILMEFRGVNAGAVAYSASQGVRSKGKGSDICALGNESS